ncbi:MAG: hypothetical protein AN483_21050 [Aphanizomenon flos-aquae MDT14a]|nr:MAG: hypothetical protein AN483_21050 [Aphanizomenon flos-aquae MDT14a]
MVFVGLAWRCWGVCANALFAAWDVGCGGMLPKRKTLALLIVPYVFCRYALSLYGALAGGTGVVRALVQMLGLRLGETAAGEYCQNTKPLLCGYCNMFFVAKAGQILGF